MLMFCFVVFIVQALIFCLRFSQKQSGNLPKKIQGNVLLINWKAHAKIQALLKEKIYPKKSLTSLLQQAIQLWARLRLFICQVFVGGVVASWLVGSSPDRTIWVWALARDIVLCSWARHFTLTLSLTTQVYKWVPVNLMLEVTLRWTGGRGGGGGEKYA